MNGLAYDYIIDMMHVGLRATRSLLVLGAGVSGGRVGLGSEAIAMCASIITNVSNFLYATSIVCLDRPRHHTILSSGA
jgi:hypothetical protein